MPLAIAQNSVDRVTMMKLGGAGNIAEITSPPQIAARHSSPDTTIDRNGVLDDCPYERISLLTDLVSML